MPVRQIDPVRLQGEALRRWYLRTPDEIEQERQTRQAQHYQAFFGAESLEAREGVESLSQATPQIAPPDADALWMASGHGGYRKIQRSKSDFEAALEPDRLADHPSYLPASSAALEAGEFHEVGNPYNPRLRREWERANNRPWPRTADGRPYDVAHIRAIADGGTNTLDNIRPMERAEHMASHREDASRFGKRASIARAFGGTVEPPLHAPRRANTPASPPVKATPLPHVATPPTGGPARGPRLSARGGALGILSEMLGRLSGRLPSRIDTWDNYRADLLGEPSMEDRRKATEDLQRLINPKWKPGDPSVA